MVPCWRSAKLARLEAVLFGAGEPLPARKLVRLASLSDHDELRALMLELQLYYDSDATAFTIEQGAGGWQLRTRQSFAPWLDKYIGPALRPTRLSGPALETLAIIAYRQPVLRADIEAIRGVACSEMLRQLIERGLVRVAGHHDSLGRPKLYATTRKFLELFGISDLSQLPMATELRAAAAAVPAPTEEVTPDPDDEDGDHAP